MEDKSIETEETIFLTSTVTTPTTTTTTTTEAPPDSPTEQSEHINTHKVIIFLYNIIIMG